MKVLFVNSVYQTGSTGKIVYDTRMALRETGTEFVACYGRGASSSDPCSRRICSELYTKYSAARSCLSGIRYGGCELSTGRLLHIIRKEKPDLVHLHCINSYFVNIYRLMRWLKKHRIPTVLTLHADFMYTGGCSCAVDCDQWRLPDGCGSAGRCPHWRQETKSLFFNRTASMWRRMKEIFDGYGDTLVVTAVSPWLSARAKASPILGDKKHYTVTNGLDIGIFHPYDTAELKRGMGLDGRKIIFFVTPIFDLSPGHLKGCDTMVKVAEHYRDSGVTVLVAAPHPANTQVPDNVILLGRVSDQQLLAKYYAMADVTLLASTYETFSMVTAESLCCGTPVAGWKAGGPESIGIEGFSVFVERGDFDGLYAAIDAFLTAPPEPKQIAAPAAHKYCKEEMAAAYWKIYQELLAAQKKQD